MRRLKLMVPGQRARLAALSGLVAAMVHVTVWAIFGTRPFGHRSIGVGDFGTQYLPFHSLLRDVLTGSPLSNWAFTWTNGAGVGFLPDYATYLASPFALLVVIVPANHVEDAMMLAIMLRMGLAAAAMVLLLWELRPSGKRWLMGLLGVCYATASWITDVGVYTPQWLDALWLLPLLCLAGLWARRRAHWLLSVIIAGVMWWSNYYTAYMATLEAGLFMVTHVLAFPTTWRQDVRSLVRFCVTTIIGIFTASVLLVPTYVALKSNNPLPGNLLPVENSQALFTRFLPWTQGSYRSPDLFAGSVVLVLVLALPAARHLSLRSRIAFIAWPVLLVTSSVFPPLLLVWSAFDEPNGSAYRWVFVIAAALTVCAWLASNPTNDRAILGPIQLVTSGVLLGAIMLAARGADVPRLVVDDTKAFLFPAIVFAAVVLASIRLPKILTASVLVALTIYEAGGSMLWMMQPGRLRGFLAENPTNPTVLAYGRAQAARFTEAAQWPLHRVGQAQEPKQTTWNGNDPGMMEFPGTSYYSTLLPRKVSRALIGLGTPLGALAGRRLIETADVIYDQLMAISVRARSRGGKPASIPSPQPAMPMVRTVASSNPPQGVLPRAAITRNALFAKPVYMPPRALSVTLGGANKARSTEDSYDAAKGSTLDFAYTCEVGTTPMLARGSFTGSATVSDGKHALSNTSASWLMLSTKSTTGTVHLEATRTGSIDRNPIACLDAALATAQIANAPAPDELSITPGRVRARFDAPQSGRMVVASPAIDGWTCRVDGDKRSINPLSGLLAVDVLDAHSLDCTYRPPGIVPGVALSVVAWLTAIGVPVLARRVERPAIVARRAAD